MRYQANAGLCFTAVLLAWGGVNSANEFGGIQSKGWASGTWNHEDGYLSMTAMYVCIPRIAIRVGTLSCEDILQVPTEWEGILLSLEETTTTEPKDTEQENFRV